MILPPHRGQARPRVVRVSTSIASGLSSDIIKEPGIAILESRVTTSMLGLLPRLQTPDSGGSVSSGALGAAPCRFNTTKIVQKIVTGGVNSTNTPILKFLIKNALFEPASDARHIAHCARPDDSNARNAARVSPTISHTRAIRTAFINGPPQMSSEAAP